MNRLHITHYFLLYSLALFLSLTSCSSLFPSRHPMGELQSVMLTLEGKDPVVLSETNPFLAPNQLVTLLKEHNPSVRGFISKRGIPDAVHVLRATEGESVAEFFYLAPDERFRLEQQKSLWSVLGPSPIQREFILPLRQAIRKRMKTPSPGIQKTSPVGATEDPFIQRLNEVYGDASQERPQHTGPLIPFKEKILGLLQDGDFRDASLNKRGDIVHQKKSQQESYKVIALWYTFEPDNGPRIARINGEKSVGETILVPSYLVKNKKTLPENLVQQLLAMLSSKL